jgi:hypothetical protein
MNLTESSDRQQTAKVIYYHFFRDLWCPSLWLKNKFIVASRNLMKLLPFRKLPFTEIGGKRADVFFGSDYWAITLPCARHVHEKLCTEKKMTRYFKTCFIPSELCIQTIVFNSPFAPHALLYKGRYPGLAKLTPLHHIVYGESIKTMTSDDLPMLKQSGRMFCRKVVSGESDTLVEAIEAGRRSSARDCSENV